MKAQLFLGSLCLQVSYLLTPTREGACKWEAAALESWGARAHGVEGGGEGDDALFEVTVF